MALYQYAISRDDTASNGAGTLTCSQGATAVTGGSTAFTTALTVGSVIIVAGIKYAVDVITDNTHLTLSRAAEAAMSGASYQIALLSNVEAMTYPTPAPKSTFRPYTDSVELANGKLRGLGRPVATWRWGFITRNQRDQLRTYCTAKSNSIYFRTRTNEGDAYETFTATIIWPDDEDKQTGRRLNFVLEFKNLVQL